MTATLFHVDNTSYSQTDCERLVQPLTTLDSFRDTSRMRLAVCLQRTADWLALCLWLKDRGASVLPIHPGTPATLHGHWPWIPDATCCCSATAWIARCPRR